MVNADDPGCVWKDMDVDGQPAVVAFGPETVGITRRTQ
jgi:hypothetical protein